MTLPVPHELVDKMVAEYERAATVRREATEAPSSPRIITLARSYGAGCPPIAQELGNRLGWHVWDRDILDVLASESHGHYQARMFESLDEKAQGLVESLLSFCFGGADEQTYLYLLHKALIMIAHHDGIIVGRSAYLVLPNAFHVFIKASLAGRIKTITARLNVSEKEAREAIEEKDRERETFRKHFAERVATPISHDTADFDLEISTDRLSTQEAATLIESAATTFFQRRDTTL